MSEHPLKKFRDEREMTQEALARLIGVETMTVSRWERGRMPRRAYWGTIHEKTGIDPAKLAAHYAESPMEAR